MTSKKTEPSTEVAKPEEAQAPVKFDYGNFGRKGFEGTTMDDLSIPFINVAQDNSKAYKEGEIPGLEPGMLWNSVTNEVITTPQVVIPVRKEANVVEWRPRHKGGGLVERYGIDYPPYLEAIKANGGSKIPPKDDEGKRIAFKSPEGNELIETHYMYVMLMSQDGKEMQGFGLMAFTSTKITTFKKWISAMMLQATEAPLFAYRCKLDTKKQTQGDYSFYNLSILPFKETWVQSLIDPKEELHLLQQAEKYHDMIMQGDMKADFEKQGRDDEVETDLSKIDSAETSKQKQINDEIPF